MFEIKNKCDEFEAEYRKLIRYADIDDKFKSDELIANYSQEKINNLENINIDIGILINELVPLNNQLKSLTK